ncbi:MAG TPA: hypothetical protein VJJ73_00555 [Candidatus Paceibacterota bacterium]
MKILITIIISMLILLGLNYMFPFSKKSAVSQIVTLRELESNKQKYDGQKVVMEGTYEHMFEVEAFEGKIWLDRDHMAEHVELPTFSKTRIRAYGTIHTKGTYGHLGMYPFLLTADRVEVLYKITDEKITESRAGQIAIDAAK